LNEILGKRRAKWGIFEGNMTEGELEIGQIAGAIHDIKPAADVLSGIWQGYLAARQQLISSKF
jgi:enoyl-[acyl-carrier protein] reductase II